MRWQLLLLLLAVVIAPSAARAEPPNIVVLLADDLGIGDIGVNGQLDRAAAGLPAISTPNIDALAGQSLQFRNMYTSAPFCSPSRASLLTGFDHSHVTKEWATGFHGLRAGEQDRTWGEVLQDAGYSTAMFGKWHLGGAFATARPDGVVNFDALPTQRGFDHVFGGLLDGYRPRNFWIDDGQGGVTQTPNEADPSWPGPGAPVRFSEDVVAEKVVDFIKDQANERFGAYVAFKAPHDPFKFVEILPQYADKDWSEQHKQYASLITRMDGHVGQILAALDDPNGDGNTSDSIADDTMVIFASDNGPLWSRPSEGFLTEFFDSNSIYNGQKSNTYDAGIRTPFFVRWNGVVDPGVNDSHVGSFSDFMPTVAELVDQEAPVGIDGTSMLASIFGGQSEQQDVMLWQSRSNFRNLNQAGWAVRIGDWKLIWRIFSETYELFDLSNDPSETTNLANARPDILAALATLAEREALLEEPYVDGGDESQLNVYFTQYKQWQPQGGSTDFSAAGNWGGGTQYLRDEHEADGTEALYWNTGPASNWIATARNTGPTAMQLEVGSNATVLGLAIGGPSAPLVVDVRDGVELSARNGLRIESGAELRLHGGTLMTIRDVDVRPGGKLTGRGTITGDQAILEGIPEFEGAGLLEPRVLNAGVVDPGAETSAGLLRIEGDFEQTPTGNLAVDLFSDDDSPAAHDRIEVTGNVELDGQLSVALAGGFVPELEDVFTLVESGEGMTGAFGEIDVPALAAGLFWLPVYSDTEFSIHVVDELDADFDVDQTVDGADYLTLQRGFGSGPAGKSDGDATADGFVDESDVAVWSAQFGDQLLSATPEAATVPEPQAMLLAIWGCVALFLSSLRATRRRSNR